MKKYLVFFALFFNILASEISIENINKKIIQEKATQASFEEEELDDFPEPILISLGFNCTTARKLRDNNLRCFAFPFDWIRSSFSGICNLIEEDFKDFLNPDYLSFEKKFIFNKKYILEFYHDFLLTENFLNNLEVITEKYKRRIERLCRALNSRKTVYFFRFSSRMENWDLDPIEQTQNDVKKLRNTLSKKFPHCNFTLIVMSNDKSYKNDWELERIKNFYLQDSSSNEEWNNIFKKLELV